MLVVDAAETTDPFFGTDVRSVRYPISWGYLGSILIGRVKTRPGYAARIVILKWAGGAEFIHECRSPLSRTKLSSHLSSDAGDDYLLCDLSDLKFGGANSTSCTTEAYKTPTAT